MTPPAFHVPCNQPDGVALPDSRMHLNANPTSLSASHKRPTQKAHYTEAPFAWADSLGRAWAPWYAPPWSCSDCSDSQKERGAIHSEPALDVVAG